MPKYATVEKQVGETPLVALERYRAMHPEYAGVPMTYAGRLDPMASGQLLVLIGDECKKREQYDGLDKEYEFEILFGFESDTGDVLGIPHPFAYSSKLTNKDVERVAKKCTGEFVLSYPVFSSKPVKGKPLFQWALEGRLGEIDIPAARVHVYRLAVEGVRTIPVEALREEVHAKLAKLETDPCDERPGSDFRKGAISAEWDRVLAEREGEATCASLRATVSSGTYIRSLVPEIAKRLGTKGLAYSIHRTRIGHYRALPFGLGVWTATF
jgi:tRNA pseudouridine55 synthase